MRNDLGVRNPRLACLPETLATPDFRSEDPPLSVCDVGLERNWCAMPDPRRGSAWCPWSDTRDAELVGKAVTPVTITARS